MNKYQFKTNINCGGCIAKVTPHLSANKQIKSWSVDTQHPNKVLTIETEHLTDERVKEIVRQAGFTAEPIS